MEWKEEILSPLCFLRSFRMMLLSNAIIGWAVVGGVCPPNAAEDGLLSFANCVRRAMPPSSMPQSPFLSSLLVNRSQDSEPRAGVSVGGGCDPGEESDSSSQGG